MQAIKVVVPMDARGNLRLPEEVRRELEIDGASLIEVEIVDGSWVLRPTEAIPDDDVWAYTPEHVAMVKRALSEGGGREMSEAELNQFIADATN